MGLLRCDRCGTLFDPDERFMTGNVDVLGQHSRQTVSQVLLCGACTDAVGENLSLDTTVSEHG